MQAFTIILLLAFSQSSLAGRTITSASLNNTTVIAGSNVVITVNVTTDEKGNKSHWKSTGWLLATSPGTLICDDSPNINKAGNHSSDIENIQAPTSPGTYNLYLVAYNKDGCSSSPSAQFILPNALTVTAIPDSITINSASVDGSSTTNVIPNATVSVSLNATTTGSENWRSTGWRIAGSSGLLVCNNHANLNGAGTADRTFDVTAPSTDGTYNLYLVGYDDNSCSGDASNEFVLSSSVIVTTPDSITINSASVDGSSTTNVIPNATVSVSLNATTTGSENWRSTGWRIAGSSGVLACNNHANLNGAGTADRTFDVTAPSTDGTYNLYLVGYDDNSCSGDASNEFVLSSSVIVTTPVADIDHFELHYSANGLTCLPSDVTVKACENTDCTSLYSNAVDVTLSPASGWSSNPASLSSGTTTVALSQVTAANVTVGISSSSIAPSNALKCYADGILDANCRISFVDSLFEITVPTLTACKTATATIKAITTDSNTNTCKAALSGNRDISFWNTFVSPSTSSTSVSIESTAITSASSGTPVRLRFSSDGEASFDIAYDAAGQINLSANYTAANGKKLSGTSNTFVSKPVGLAIYSSESSSACLTEDASCGRFKKAGEAFNLEVKAACWESDGDSDFSDNPATPNFALSAITTNHNLLSSGITAGTISTTSFDFTTADSGLHSLSQTVSEVGVFEFGIVPPSYFSETLTTQVSPAIGRFYPDHFKLSTVSDGSFDTACTGFNYSGQDFSYQTKPELKVTAYNAATPAVVTQNYTGSFAKLSSSDFTVTAPTSDATQLGVDATNKVALTWMPASASLTDNADGSLNFSFGADDFSYTHEANSKVNAFTSDIDLIFSAITDSDNVSAQATPYTLQPTGTEIRFGRFTIENAHGSELVPLPVTMATEYFNGINWVTNTADQCTMLNQLTDLQLANPATSSGSWLAGNTTMTIGSGNSTGTLTNNTPLVSGKALLTFSAPGEDNQGYIDIRSQLSANYDWLLGDYDNDGAYDDDPIGRASFGIFSGSDNIIFRRELY